MSAVQENCEIFSVQKVGDYFQFTVVAPGIAKSAKPGQFVAVGVGGENSAMLLRRAFALYNATPGGEFAGTIQFVVAEHGAGTRWLTQRRTGDVIDIVGPLGTPFPIPAAPSPAVLVGGGYGTAPLIPLAQALLANGSAVEIILGAASVGRLFGEMVAKRMAGQFFKAIDNELTGVVTPIAAAPSAVAAAGEAAVAAPAAAGPQVFGGRPAAAAAGPADVKTLALAAVGGALLTLIGVLIGHRLARTRTSPVS